jgi:hypothetical protein
VVEGMVNMMHMMQNTVNMFVMMVLNKNHGDT